MQIAYSIVAELEEAKISYEYSGAEHVKCQCPFHQDQNPSCSINVKTGGFKCHGCGAKGFFEQFLAQITNLDSKQVRLYLAEKYGLSYEKAPIDPQLVEKAHARIFEEQYTTLREELYKRAVSDEMIREYRLGIEGNRITIPIPLKSGGYVNIRKYLPGASAGNKMLNVKKRGDIHFFPIDQLGYDTVVLAGGEVKALAGIPLLNKHGIGCVSTTGGEGNWDPSLTHELRGKSVYITFDADPAGEKAAVKVGSILRNVTRFLSVIALNEGQGLDDFIANGGDPYAMLNGAEEFAPKTLRTIYDEDEDPRNVPVAAAASAQYERQRLRVKGLYVATAPDTYFSPRNVVVECEKNSKSCARCSVNLEDKHEFTVSPESALSATISNLNEDRVISETKKELGIPGACRVNEVTIVDSYSVIKGQMSPPLGDDNDAEVGYLTVCSIDERPMPGETYEVIGRTQKNRRTSRSSFVGTKFKASQDSLEEFEPNFETLKVFQPKDWSYEAVQEKMNDIYSNLERGVTRIFERRELHEVIDLTYHSALRLPNGQPGWLQALIVGDTAQGKSETAQTLRDFYKLGYIVDCKSATAAGLIATTVQNDGDWFSRWGALARNDRRLVTLEEFKALRLDIQAALTQIRSSGVISVTKAREFSTNCRVRLICISNAGKPGESSKPLNAYGQKWQAFPDVVPNEEDLRRFDFGIALRRDEVDVAGMDIHDASCAYSATACRELITWAWSRKREDITLDVGVKEEIKKGQVELLNDFALNEFLLLEPGTIITKIQKIAIAVAIRLCSNKDDKVLVRTSHVKYTIDLLRRLYTLCDVHASREQSHDAESQIDEKEILEYFSNLPYPRGSLRIVKDASILTRDTMTLALGDEVNAQSLLTLLASVSLIRAVRNGYRKEHGLNSVLESVYKKLDDTKKPEKY